jgi:predicted N-acetyltransferase YhbS
VKLIIRHERAGDEDAVHEVTEAAFRGQPHSDGSEPALVDRLRIDGDLAISLIAEVDEHLVGHIALSRVAISDGAEEWYGLGPVSVLPAFQRRRIGAQLIQHGLAELRERGGRGVVLLGDPTYYSRFGFEHDPALAYPGPPERYFQRLVLEGEPPRGVVTYALAFG